MKQSHLSATIFASAISFISVSTYAVGVSGQGTWETTLLPRDLDGDLTTAEAFYDKVVGITWLADTKLIASNTFGLPYDTELDSSDPVYQVIHSDGKASWWGAKYWLDAMNAANYGGTNQWRLPMMMDTGEPGCDYSITGGTDCGYNVQTTSGSPPYPATTVYSELGSMYYDTLGNLDGYGFPLPPEKGLTNTGPFDSIQIGELTEFWTGLPVPLSHNVANVGWYFIFNHGVQHNSNESPEQYAWAVHDGDVGEGLIPSPPAYIEVAKLTASDGEARDYFGATLTVEGDTILVGQYSRYEGPIPVYIYTNTGDVWTEQGKLTSSDNDDYFFGYSVSIDGDTALIGAPFGGYEYDPGTAYVFVRTSDTWSEQAQLRPSGWVDIFAWSVSIDGDTAVVGGILDDQPGENGSAYVYVRDDGIWTEQAILKPSGSTGEDQGEETFGNAVAIDSDTIVVGNGFDWNSQKRVVYVFTRTNGVWTEQAKLKASDDDIYLGFGSSVALDGDTAVIGAPGGYFGRIGGAYVFKRTNGIWTEQAILTAEDLVAGDRFATSVSVSGDTLVVGGIQDYRQDDRNGFAYVFVRDNGTWIERAKIRGSDSEAGDYFGASVSISGNIVAAGATRDDDNGINSGSAYVFGLTEIVTIDIKPSKKPENLIYLNKGKYLRVAILGSSDFDALQVDPASLKFGPDGAMPIRYKGRDYNHDGYSDLALTFVLSETGIACGDTYADLIGQSISNPVKYIAGTDSFNVEPCP